MMMSPEEFLRQSNGFLPVSCFAANLPLGFRFQVAEEQLSVHLDPAVYGAAPAPRPCVVSLTPT